MPPAHPPFALSLSKGVAETLARRRRAVPGPINPRPASRFIGPKRPELPQEFFGKNSYTRKDAGFLALARAAVRSPSRLAMHKLSPACWSVTDLAPSRTGTRGSYGAT